MPSARRSVRPRLWTRMAWEMTGVGVNPSSRWMTVSTSFAARTSSAVRCAGAESAWVSLPMKSGPLVPWVLPVVADGLSDRKDMRFGERAAQRRAAMPAGAEADSLRGSVGSGRRSKYSRSSRARSTNISFGAGLPASGEMCHSLSSAYVTGQGFAFQISVAYCAIVRSLENLPEPATLRIALRAHPSRSAYSSQSR